MQLQMKNLYNFKNQIAHIDEICQTNILAAEIANSYLRKMCPQLIRRICQEVKKECEEEYHNDEERMQSVKQALNLLKREQVTNVDELFMDLRDELNSYYEVEGEAQLLKCRKYKPYLQKCPKCQLLVSSHAAGVNYHKAKSCYAVKKETPEDIKVEGQKTPEANQKKIKKVDTEFLYEQRQKGHFGGVKVEEPEEGLSKRKMKELKRQRKLEEDRLKKQRRMAQLKINLQKGMSLSRTASEYYCQQDDEELAKKYNHQQHARSQQQVWHSQHSSAQDDPPLSFAQ